MREMDFITRYENFHLQFDASSNGDDSRDLEIVFARCIYIMTVNAKEVKCSPLCAN